MQPPTGKIQSFDASRERATVAVDSASACPRCAAGKGCGAGLLTGSARQRTVEVATNGQANLAVGDQVELHLAPVNVLAGALQTYGVPLLGLLAGSLLALALAVSDLAAAAFSALGLIAGIAASRRALRRPACLQQFTPSVAKRL